MAPEGDQRVHDADSAGPAVKSTDMRTGVAKLYKDLVNGGPRSALRNQFHHIDIRLEVRCRHDQPPPVRADPLDIAGDVALLVLAVLQRSGFIGERKRAEEDVADRIPGKDQPNVALSAAELTETLQCLLGTDPAGEAGRRNVRQV